MGKAENYVEGYLCKKAKEQNLLCLKFTSPGFTGVPDRILIGQNKIHFVETKAKDGHLSKKQKAVIRILESFGMTVHIPYTRPEVDQIIQQFIEKE